MTEKIVLPDDPAAAQYRTGIKGWVSRHGRFFGDGDGGERLARIDGCTHTRCKRCGSPNKYTAWRLCPACREQDAIAKFNAMPRAEWDGKAMLFSDEIGEFYADLDEAEDALCGEDDITLADLRLIICVPEYVRQLDPADFADDMPDDCDVPEEVYEAIEAFNEDVAGIVTGWRPGKYALRLDEHGGAQ